MWVILILCPQYDFLLSPCLKSREKNAEYAINPRLHISVLNVDYHSKDILVWSCFPDQMLRCFHSPSCSVNCYTLHKKSQDGRPPEECGKSSLSVNESTPSLPDHTATSSLHDMSQGLVPSDPLNPTSLSYRLQTLFARYPNLRKDLKDIYLATQESTPSTFGDETAEKKYPRQQTYSGKRPPRTGLKNGLYHLQRLRDRDESARNGLDEFNALMSIAASGQVSTALNSEF